MARSSLRHNAIWNLAEVVGTSVVLFIIYRLILKYLGVSALGVWSLVLATTSMARVADLGAAGGLGRYIALSRARGDVDDHALVYVETALITNVIFYTALGLALYQPAWWALGHATHGDTTIQARTLLPFAIGSFVLQNISSVITAALVGFHRSGQKSVLTLFTLIVQASVTLATIGIWGLRGVALGQIVQCTLLTLIGWIFVVRASGRRDFALPSRISRTDLRELMGFGLRLQLLSIASFLFDPLTKFAFSAFSGVDALGMYELASRGIAQARQLVVAPSQNLTPLFTAAHHEKASELHSLFDGAMSAVTVAGSLSMFAMAAGSPLISYIWLHHVDWTFVSYSLILAVGWFVNILAVPGWFLGLGTGILRWNIAGSLLSTMCSPALGLMLAQRWAGIGIAIGAMLALAAGSLLTWLMNCREFEIRPVPSRIGLARFLRSIPRKTSPAQGARVGS